MRVPRWLVLLAANVVLAGGAYGVAAAASGGDGIAVCAQQTSGQLRLAGDAGCRNTEVALNLAASGGAGGAYAYVSNGQLDLSRSAGVNGMTFSTAPLSAGGSNVAAFYCFDLESPASTAVATESIVTDGSGGLVFSEAVNGTIVAGSPAMSAAGCPAGTDAAVMAGWNSDSTPPQDASFSVHFH